MAIVIGGHETGLLDGSLTILDRADRTRNTDPGGGEQIYVNVASGNLTVQKRDVFMPSLGQDFELTRTYNSRPVPAYEVRLPDNRWAMTYNVFIMDKTINGQKTYEVTYADGSTLLYRWDASINAYKSIDGDGAFEVMRELTDSGGELQPWYEVTRADQSRMIFTKHGRLLEWVDTNGVKTEFSYNAQLYLSQVRDDLGHVIDYVYANNRIVRVEHNEFGTLAQYTYTSNGRMASVTDRNGHITRYYYNNDGYLSRIELPDRQLVNGVLQTFEARVYEFEYEVPPIDWTGSGSKQLLTRIIGPDGTYTTFEYDHDVGNNGTPPDPNKRPEDQWFRGGVTKMVDPLGNARARSNDLEYRQWRLDNGYYEWYDASREIPTWPWEPVPDPAYKALVDEIRNAHSITYEFDEDSYITAVTDQQGYTTQYSYDAQNNVTAVVDRNGSGITTSDSDYFRALRADLGYTDLAGEGKLVAELSQAEKDALLEAFTTHYEYDNRGNLTQQIDNANDVTTWTYTAFNKVASTTSAVGHALTVSDEAYYQEKRLELGYSALAAGLSSSDKTAILDLYTTYFEYDTRQNVIERRDEGGDITKFEYDLYGNLVTTTVHLDASDLADPDKQQVTQYEYDKFGNVIATIDAEGHRFENEYDYFGNLTRHIDAKGAETLYTYDGDDRLISTTSAMGNTTVFAYDAVGNRIATTDANGHKITNVFDVHNNLIASLNPSDVNPARDRETQFTYDVVGNRTSMTDAEGRQWDYEFNTRRELVKTITAEVDGEDGVTQLRYESTTIYDGVGNRVKTTDNRGFSTEFIFTQDHLVRRQTSAIGHITQYTYDANDNQIQIVAGMQLEAAKRQILKFNFDEEDQLIEQTDAMGGESAQTYDAVGNRLSFTDENGNATEYEFDKNNRSVLVRHPHVVDPTSTTGELLKDEFGNPVEYTFQTIYDGNGNVVEEIDENGNRTKYTFDRDSRLVVTEDAIGTKSIFEYDSRNNRTRVIIDGDATVSEVTVTEPFEEHISYEDFEDGWGDYEPGGDDAIMYSGTTYAFEGSNAANIRDNSGTESSFISAPDIPAAPTDPTDPEPVIPVPDATYNASSVGTAGCTGAGNCTLESWGIDLNEGTGFQWTVDGGTGGNAEMYLTVATPSSTRAMSVWLNGQYIGVISTNPNEAPRPTGKEFGPFVVDMNAGNNTVELRDTEGLAEFDAHNVRIVGLPAIEPPPPFNDIPETTYLASDVGTAGCTGAGNCTLESWGIDINANTGFQWTIDGGTGSGGEAELWVKVASPAGNRAMSLWVNGLQVGVASTDASQAPRPSGQELGPFLVNLNAGTNTVELRDTQGTAELDAHHVRVVAVQNNTQQTGQTGQPGDGPGYDFTKYDQVDMDFAFYAEHLTAGESFFVEYWDGVSWSVVKEYKSGTDFQNFVFNERHLTLTDTQYNFTDNVKFRFRGNTQDDARNVFIDQINIEGSGVKTRTYQEITVAEPTDESVIKRYVYNEFNELVGYIDGMGNALLESNSALYQDQRVKLGYAADNNGLSAADRAAIEALYTATSDYDRVGNLVQTKDNEGRVTTFEYDALNRQREINHPTDAATVSGTTEMRFDGNGNLVERIDANNNSTLMSYDAVNRLIDTRDALGVLDRNVYDDFGNRIAETRAVYEGTDPIPDEVTLPRTTQWEYDLNNRLKFAIRPEGDEVEYFYDAVGNRIAMKDGRGNTTNYQYDAMNRNIKVIDPLTFETIYEYDGVGNQLRITDPRGGVRAIEYDALNRRIKLTDAEQRITEYDYDVRSNQIEMREVGDTPPNLGGQIEVTKFEYDAENNLRKVIDAEGGETISDFDRVYNVVSVVDANGNETITQFDALNRQIKIIDALAGETKIDYDAVGNRLLVTDQLNNTTEYRYDVTNRVTEEVNARGVVTQFQYDDVDNRVSITRAANVSGEESTTEFFYDLNDRLVRQVDAEGNETLYEYDENDNRERVTDARGNVTEYTFDERNLVTAILDPEGYTTNYVYDENQNRIEINDGRNNSRFSFYNGNNEIKIAVDAEGFATTYEYDFNGNLVRETLHMEAVDTAGLNPAQGEPPIPSNPAIDQVTQYEYDKLNRLTARIDAEGYRLEYSYDAVGNRLTETQYRTVSGADDVDEHGITRPGQSTMHYFYDDLYRQTEKVTGEGYLHKSTHDAVGNVLSRTIYDDPVVIPVDGSSPVPVDVTAGRTTTYQYDTIYRLDIETSASGTKTKYEYDERSNQTAVIKAFETTAAQPTDYVYDLADRMVEMIDAKGTRTHYELDGNGNIEKMHQAFETPDQRTTEYHYDGNNRQDEMTDAKGNKTRTVYDGNGNVIQIDRAFNRTEARTESFAFDKNNRMTSETNGELERTEYVLDGAGNRILKREGIDATLPGPGYGPRTDIRETTYIYDKDNRLDQEIDADGIVTKYRYDGADNTLEKIEAFGQDGTGGGEAEERSYVMAYDLDNRMTRRIDPMRLGETTYTHDALGNVLTVTDANGHRVTNSYDEIGRLVTTVSHENVATTHTYDRRDNITSTTTYLFDPLLDEGEPREEERTTRFHYDILDNQIRIDDPEDFSTTMGYDVFNNKIWERRGLYLVPSIVDGQTNPDYSAEKAALADVSREHHFEYDALDRMTFEVHGAMGDNEKVENILPSLTQVRVMAYDYNAHGEQISMVDNFAVSGDKRTTVMIYDNAGREIEKHTPENGLKFSTYNVHGEKILTTQLQNQEFDDEDVLIGETWIETEYEYDDLGQMTAMVDGEGNRTEYDYDVVGNQTLICYGVTGTNNEFAKAEIEKDYDLNNRLVTDTNALDFTTSYFYDAVGNVVKTEDARGNTAFKYYDGDNRLTLQVNEERYATRKFYDTLGNVVQLENFANPVSESVNETTPPIIPTFPTSTLDRQSKMVFDGRGLLIEKTEAFDSNTSDVEKVFYQLDSLGNVRVETDDLGRQTIHSYDSESRVTSIKTADGVTNEYVYDNVGNNIQTTYAASKEDPVTGVLDFSDIAYETYSYDKANRLIAQRTHLDSDLVSGEFLEVTFKYDNVGNKTNRTDAKDNTSEWEYDLNNREIEAINAQDDSINTAYDYMGNVIQVRDANGNYTTNYFDADNQIKFSVDGEGWVKGYSYDENGNLIEQRLYMSAPYNGVTLNAGGEPSTNVIPTPTVTTLDQVVTYAYDRANRKDAQVDGESYVTEYILDAFGNQTRIRQLVDKAEDTQANIARWAEINRYYDSANRMTHEVSAEGYLTYYVYDTVGNLVEKNSYADTVSVPADGVPVGDPAGEIKYVYRYDNVNRLIEEVSPQKMAVTEGGPLIDVVTRYGYDGRGNQTFVTKAADYIDTVSGDEIITGQASTTSYEFDKANRLERTRYADGETQTFLVLDGNGNVLEEHLAYETDDVRVTIFQYDANNRVEFKTLAANDSELSVTTHFFRDANGNVIRQEEAYGVAGQTRTTVFEYDGNNRAVAEIRLVNNPDNPTDDTDLREERSELRFDGAGNQILKIVAAGTSVQRITGYEYDLDNRLAAEVVGMVEVSEDEFTGGTRSEYFYDGFDNKVRTVQAVGVSGEERTSYYTYDLESRLTSIKDPEGFETFYEYDVHGNQEVITDANGNSRYNDYDKMGRVLRSEFEGILVTSSYDLRGNAIKKTQSDLDGVTNLRETYYGFDLLDQQRWIVDAEGFASTMDYDLVGNQIAVTTGLYLPGLIGAANDPEKADLAIGRSSTTRFEFDKLNRQIKMITAEGAADENTRFFAYDIVGNKIGETEAYGTGRENTVVHTYDTANRLVQSNDPEGGITKLRYNEAGEKILQQMLQQDGLDPGDPAGQIWIEHTFDYDQFGRLQFQRENTDIATASDFEKLVTEFEYDSLGNLKKQTAGVNLPTSEQRITEKNYDLNNNVILERDAEGNDTTYTYDGLGNRTSVTDARGNSAYYYFDAHGNTIKILDGNRFVSEFIYDSANNRREERIYATKFVGSIPASGQADLLTVASDTQDRLSSSTYNQNNKIKSRTDADGSHYEYFYDATGNLIKEEKYLNGVGTDEPLVLTYEYDLQNRVKKFTDANDSVTETKYDASNNKREVRITESTGLSSEDISALEAIGFTGLSEERTSITTYDYDLSNRQIRQTFDPTGLNIIQEITYDEMGNAISKTNANDVIEYSTYNRQSQITSNTNGEGNTYEFVMDQFGNQRFVDNPRAFTEADDGTFTAEFEYDRMGRVRFERQPEVEMYYFGQEDTINARPTTEHIYDEVGNEIQTIDANGHKTTRYFDANNQVIAEVNGDNVLTKWTYNAFGDKTSQTLYMTYLADGVAHVDLVNVPAGDESNVQHIDYTYDLAGRLIDTTYPDVRHVATELDLTNDSVNIPELVEGEDILTADLVESRTYDFYGQLEKLTDRRGYNTYTWYDGNGQLLAQVDAANYLTTFAYDGQGNVAKQSSYMDALAEDFITGDRPSYEELTSYIDDLVNPKVQTVYRLYDLASRMTHEVAPAIEIFDTSTMSDEDLVNLTSVSINPETNPENVITQYTYDNAGNEVSKTLAAGATGQETTEYSFYDAANRRIALVDGARGLSTFEYDANGNRTKMTRHFSRINVSVDLESLSGDPAYKSASDFAGLSVASENDQVIENTFNALNQESTRIERMDAGSADDLTTRYWYDGMNQKTFSQEAMTSDEYDASAFATGFEYNARGKVTKIKSADGTIKHSEYDAAGNLVRAFTGEVTPPDGAALNSDVTVEGDGLRVSWTSTETFGVQTYVVYGETSQSIDTTNINAQQYTSLTYDYVAIPTQTHPTTVGETISAVIRDDIGSISGGDTVYYRVVTQNTGGSLSWSEERSVVIPIKVSDIEVVQRDEDTVSVVVSFNGSPSSAPDLNISGTGTVSRTSLGGNSYRFDISGDNSLQDETYQIEWQSAGQTFTTNNISFESKGPHYGVSSGLNEIIVPVGSENRYRIETRTVIADEENLAELNVNWFSGDTDISGSLNMAVGGSKSETDGDKIIFNYEIGQPTALEAGDYTIVIRGVYEDGSSSVIDFIDVTVGDGSLFNITRHSASVKRLVSGSRQVFVNGERTGSTSEVNSDGVTRNVIFNLNNLEGSRDRYTILYGDLVAEDHTLDVSTTAEDAVSVIVDLEEAEFDRIDSDELWIAYKDTSSNGLYSNVSAMTADDTDHSYSIEFDSLAVDDEKDFKIFYFDGGQEVVVELFRYARGDGSISRTEQSRMIDAAEYDGSIEVDDAPSGPQDPDDPDSDPLYPNTLRIAVEEGLLFGSNDNFTVPGVTLTSTQTNSDVGDLTADGFSVGYYTINEYNSINARIGTNDQTGNWRTFDIDGNGNAVRTLDYGEHLYIEDEVVLKPVDPLQSFKTYDGRNRATYEYTPILEYSVDGDEWSVTGSARGTLAEYTYNALDKIEKQVDPTGITTLRSYDLAGNLIEEVQASGEVDQRVKLYYYDRKGNETAVVSENAIVLLDATGEPEANTVDHLHLKKYDSLSNMVAEVGAEVNLKTIEYDEFSRVEIENISSSIYIEFKYDHRNRVISQEDVLGNTTLYQYDGRDNRIETTDAENNVFSQDWDPLGQAIADYTPGNESGRISKTKQYDAYGNVIAEFDEMGRSNRSVYGAFSKLLQTVDQGGRTTTYQYDPWGRVIGESRGEKDISKKYDSLGRLTDIIDNSTGVTTEYRYDLVGRREREIIIDNGDTVRDITYEYDSHGQMTRWSDAASEAKGAHLNYEWYDNGNLYRVYTDADGWDPREDDQTNSDGDYRHVDHIYYYDRNNRLVKINQKGDSDQEVTYKEYEYNADGTRAWAKEIVYKDDVGYDEDDEGTSIVHHYEYYANGWVHTAEWESGTETYKAEWTYDNVGNVEKYTIHKDPDGSPELIQENVTKYLDNYRIEETVNKSRTEDNELSTQTTTKTLDESGRVLKSKLKTKVGDGDETSYDYSYAYSSDGRETKITASGTASGSSVSTYDINDNLIRLDKGESDGADGSEYLTFKYNNEDQILYRFHEQGDNDKTNTNTEFLYANSNPIGEIGNNDEGDQYAELDTGRYNLVQKLDDSFPTPTISSYSIRRGDTLQSIALSMYGNASLWFVLADANGLQGSSELKEGTRLTVPTHVSSGRLTSDAHVQYSDSAIIGSTLPNLKSPPPKKKNGCVQILVIILVVIVAVVAAIFTAGIGGAIVGAAGAGLVATLGALALAGLVGAAIALAANAITQGIYIAFGMQKEFDWNAFAFAGAAGFVTGVAAGLGAAAQAVKASAELISLAKVAVPLLRITAASIQQLGNDADGDGKPDWKITSWVGLAAAGASGVFEGASYGAGAAKDTLGAAAKGGADGVAQGGGTISTIQTVVEYVTPWAELAESYIRYETGDNKDQPFDWLSGVASAVAGNLITAVESPLQESLGGNPQAFSTRLGVSIVNTAINTLTAGVMSAIDPKKGEAFLISSVGNEIGQFIGGVLKIEGGLDNFAKSVGTGLANSIYGDPEAQARAEAGIAAGQAAAEASKNARKGQQQQQAAVTEQSQSAQAAGYVSTSEPPLEAVESAAAEPEVQTITNKDGEQVPIHTSTVETENGKIYPWSYAKQIADEHAMAIRGEPATNMEINRQYRLLVELNGDEINFNRPLEDGTKLKTVYFDDNVAISPDTVAFAEGQAREYYRNKAIIKEKKEQARIKAELAGSMADALGVSKDMIGGTDGSGNVTAEVRELQSLLHGSMMAEVFTYDDQGIPTVSEAGLNRLKEAGINLDGVTFTVNTDDQGNVTAGIVKNGNAIALSSGPDSGLNLSVIAGGGDTTFASSAQYGSYDEIVGGAVPTSTNQYLFSNSDPLGIQGNTEAPQILMAGMGPSREQLQMLDQALRDPNVQKYGPLAGAGTLGVGLGGARGEYLNTVPSATPENLSSAREAYRTSRQGAPTNYRGINRTVKGQLGEAAAQARYLREGFLMKDGKTWGNQGIDGVYYKQTRAGQVTDVVVNEAKFKGDGKGRLNPPTRYKAAQLTPEWISQTIDELNSFDEGTTQRETGEFLERHRDVTRSETNVLDKQGRNKWNNIPNKPDISPEFGSGRATVQADLARAAKIANKAKLVGKVGLGVGVAIDGYALGSEVYESTQTGNWHNTGKKSAEIAGGWGTAYVAGKAGAAGGAYFGAALGSVVPGLGTATGAVVGGIVGGLIGGVAGYWGGSKLAGSGYEMATGYKE